MPLRAIILDYDDTLVQTRQVRYNTLKRLAKERYRFDLRDEAIDALWGRPAHEFMQILFGISAADLADLWTTYDILCKDEPNRPHAGATEFVEAFRAFMPVGILTSSSIRRVRAELQAAGLPEHLFTRIQAAEDTQMHKPDPAVFVPWVSFLAGFGIPAVEAVYVGDSLHDYRAATGAGLQFIGMAHTIGDARNFRAADVFYVTSFSDLTLHIQSMR